MLRPTKLLVDFVGKDTCGPNVTISGAFVESTGASEKVVLALLKCKMTVITGGLRTVLASTGIACVHWCISGHFRLRGLDRRLCVKKKIHQRLQLFR